jgi:hypothetical protein
VIGAGLLAFHAVALALARDAALYIVATIIAGVATTSLAGAMLPLDNVFAGGLRFLVALLIYRWG